MKILNFGSLNYDYTYAVDHLVQPGETLLARKLEIHCGGKGLNQSIALARAGISVYHAGMIGEDGDGLLDACQKNKIDTRFVSRSRGQSGHAVIQVNEYGDNCILLYSGANSQISLKQINRVLDSFEEGDLILLQNEINSMDILIEEAYKKKMRIILNPSPFNDDLKQCDLEKVSIFVVNEIEGYQITGEKNHANILHEMQSRYPKAETVLTLGENGSMYAGRGARYQCDCYQVKTVDTTAAGDTFLGYYLAGIMQGKTVPATLQQASAASAIVVSRKGASPSIPTREEVITFLNEHDDNNQ